MLVESVKEVWLRAVSEGVIPVRLGERGVISAGEGGVSSVPSNFEGGVASVL